MQAFELKDEADHLARPCVYLRTSGDAYAALWKGSPASTFELTFSSSFLPAPGWPYQGVFQLSTEGSDPAIVFLEGAKLPSDPRGLKLYATRGLSLPPLDAIFLLGSEKVKTWLRSLDWSPEWGYNDNFPDRHLVDEYTRHYMEESPFYSGSAYAVLGGWHLPWPDGDWRDLVQSQLLIWTFEGGEPWLEAWARGGSLRALERIS